ncbi:hypothetical protein Cni_G02181 [Canna indica]|uniref:Aspergillus nuclease S1 n=1 Tax=Canna indica TaxID=4628 RepID=A0AAQ3JNZ4_9LILI|nr:hypothetical protein Cni_G02181 [Canna indica]
MRFLLYFLHLVLLLLGAAVPSAQAWGKEGHYMVRKIAEELFSKRAKAAVLNLLPESAGGDLAAVWDTSIIETAMKDFYHNDVDVMLEAIKMNITDEWADGVKDWKKCREKSATCADKYATESITLSCDYAYKDVEQDITLGDDYFFSRIPVVEKRIAQAGVRLAQVINHVFRKRGKMEILELLSQKLHQIHLI